MTTVPPNNPSDNGQPDDKPNPFDPSRLRLPQDFAATVGIKKELLTVPVKKPSKEWYVRVHPDESYRLTTAVIELKDDVDWDIYLVSPELWPELSTESTFSPRVFFTSMSRQGVLFLWPVKLPDAAGKTNEWNRSMLEAATRAQKDWVRVVANPDLGAYDVFTAISELPEPEWPDKPFDELLETAFRDRFIRDLDHIVLQRLRGEA